MIPDNKDSNFTKGLFIKDVGIFWAIFDTRPPPSLMSEFQP